MNEAFFMGFVGFACLGYTWYVGITMLRHGAKEIDDLSARVDALETKEIERE